MVETLPKLIRAEIEPQPQNHAQATFAPILKKEDGRIDWTLKAEEIRGRVRGLRPWPGAYTTFRAKNLHIWSAAPVSGQAEPGHEPGTLLSDRGNLRVVCGERTLLEVHELQVEGRKRMRARDFLNGVRITADEKLVS